MNTPQRSRPPGPTAAPHRVGAFRRYSKRTMVAVLVLFLVLIAARIALPFVVQSAINRRLDEIPEYAGRVESVDVALWRGAYALNGVNIRKVNAQRDEPFFAAERIDFSLAWRELRRRHIVSDIVVYGARLNFIKEPAEEFSTLDADERWQNAIQDIFPIDITRLEIHDGFLHYIDRSADPVVDIFIDRMHAVATGLRNRPADTGEKLPATLLVNGDSVGAGRLAIQAEGDPLAPEPHFELKVELTDVNLPALNDLLRAYGNVDVSAGTMEIYLEMAARDGRFEGYVKPFFREVDFSDVGADDKSLGEKIWEKVVGVVVAVFKNKEQDQLASRVPFAGEFGDPEVGLLATIRTMLRHGFIEPLPQRLEQSVTTEQVEPKGEAQKPPPEPPAGE